MQANVQLNALVAVLRGNNPQHPLNKSLTGTHRLLGQIGEENSWHCLKKNHDFWVAHVKNSIIKKNQCFRGYVV
jgi:hypothetical protein